MKFDFLNKLFGGEGSVIADIGNVVDKLTTTKEEKDLIKLEIMKVMQSHQVDLAKLYNDDLNSARQREVEINKAKEASFLSKNIAPILALGATVLTFVIFYIVVFRQTEPSQRELIIYLLGVLSTVLSQIFSYYFGSSQEKNGKDIRGNLPSNIGREDK